MSEHMIHLEHMTDDEGRTTDDEWIRECRSDEVGTKEFG
jgi:hypothetical protein